MALTNLGKVCITPKGAWSNSTAYEILDVVSSAGASYLAKTAVPAGTALSNTTYWLQLAEKGDTGNGIASIAKTGTSGNIDTYTITYTNGDTFNFTVANSLIPDGVVAEYYDTTKSYSPGDYVLYNGGLYRCIESATGAWDGDKWENTSIGADLTLIYAKKNGYYQLMTVGYADNLTPYSSDSGTSQSVPFILQGSGCANGEEQADTGSYCQLQRKNGNTVVVNQLYNKTENITISGITFTNNNGKITISGVATADAFYSLNLTANEGHKYLIFGGNPLSAFGTSYLYAYNSGSYYGLSNGTIYRIFTASAGELGISIIVVNGYDADENPLTYEPKLIDLTQWFGSNDKIPTHLLNHPEDFFRYYQGSLANNAGALTDCNGRYLKTTWRNVWDEDWELGYYGVAKGNFLSRNDGICSKHDKPITVNSNQKYYLRVPYSGVATSAVLYYDNDDNYIGWENVYWNDPIFTTPANANFVRFYLNSIYGTTYNHDITISLYYEGESGYDQYYPYEELANIDTGNEPLLAFDYKTPDGTIHHDTGKYTFTGNETAQNKTEKTNCDRYLFYNILSSPSISDNVAKAITDNGFVVGNAYSNDVPMLFEPSGSSIYITVPTGASPSTYFKSGTVIEYELVDASKTTEQGTQFAENVAIDDFGTMAFDCPNGVPQGNTVFYPVDYKAEIDTLHNITEGDMHKIALKGELAEGEPETIEEVVDYINARIPAPPAEDGTYNLTVTVASGEATYSWVSAT